MAFFFDDGGETSTKRGKATLPLETAKKLECQVCPLKKNNNVIPSLQPTGSDNPLIYFLGDHPEDADIKNNKQFSGPCGEVIKSLIPNAFEKDIRFNNVIRTKPPVNRNPTEFEIACCRNSIETDIATTRPKVVVVLGEIALNWLFEGQRTQEFFKWRGVFFPITIGLFNTWAYCVFHPNTILKNKKVSSYGKSYKSDYDYLFESDFKKLFSQVKKLPEYIPVQQPLDNVFFTEGLKSDRELEKVLKWMEKIKQFPLIAIDYETTHLRPYVTDAKILTVAIGTDKITYAFPLDYPGAWNSRQLRTLNEKFKDFLLTSGAKIAHNTKFELEWSAFFFGVEILYDTQWEDTQAQAYILDERKGTHNLDILIRTHVGFWLKDLSPMDKSNMLAQPLNKILPYNGMDTKWTYVLFKKQIELLKTQPKLQEVYKNLISSIIMLTHVQLRGILFDPQACAKLRTEYKTELSTIEQKIQQLPEVKEYKMVFNQPFNPASPHHVLSIFRDILKVEDRLKTGAGKISSDESVLSTMTDFPLARLILDFRGYAKKISTYIDSMIDFVMPDGKIHTNYNPYRTTTGRLCVSKGTLVDIFRMKTRECLSIPIQYVQTGDLAFTIDERNELTLRKITWCGKTGFKKVLRVYWGLDKNSVDNYVDVTWNHPIGLFNGKYKRADKLNIGDKVLALTDEKVVATHFVYEIVKIVSLDTMVDVYDMGVEDTHNFIANGLKVSNSSNDPNLQNIPSKTGKQPRSFFCAPEDYVLVCCDYGQIEARLIGAASQDKNFCEALWINYDVHLEWAKKIAQAYPKVIGGEKYLEDPKALKKFRGSVKNLWVFPAFYGASYKSISAGIEIPEDLTKELFEEFWDQFSGVKKWQKWLLTRYNSLGYVESFFGRRRHAPLTANAVYNSPIQSCLQKGSMVETLYGLISIEQLVGESIKVWTGFQYAQAKGLMMGIHQLATITLKSGIKINCDVHHKLKNKENQWVDFDDLKPGDFVALAASNTFINNNLHLFECYHYDTIEKIERLNEYGKTYTLSVEDELHQFVADGVITKNSASDICVLSMEELNRKGLSVRLNVHDEVGFYIREDELEEQIPIIIREMVRPKLPWLNIPISVEVKIGKNWFEMEEVGTFLSTDYYHVPHELFDFRTIYDL